MCSKPELVVLKLVPNQPWVAPANVGQLVAVEGKGQDGTPDRGGRWGYIETFTIHINGQLVQTSVFPPAYEQSAPDDYCESPSPGRVECHTFAAFDDRKPATNGLDATGFGKTFPGGIAGPAPTLVFPNVPVIPNQVYRPVIPTGASITISYYI